MSTTLKFRILISGNEKTSQQGEDVFATHITDTQLVFRKNPSNH